MDVSIIIVNYNTKELTSNCIKSIIENTCGVDYEIIIVDNNSFDGSNVFFQNNDQISYIQNKNNLGFGAANNIGVKSSSGRYLFFLNPDTIIMNNAVQVLFNFAESHNELSIGVLGGVLIDFNMANTLSFSYFPSMTSKIMEALKLKKEGSISRMQIKKLIQNGYLKVDYVTGADMLIRRDVFGKVNGFDTDYFMYYEETDMQKKLDMLGYHNFIVDGTQIMHLEGMSQTKSYNNSKRIIVDRSMFQFFRKHRKIFEVKIFKVLYMLVRMPIIFQKGYYWEEKISYLKSLYES